MLLYKCAIPKCMENWEIDSIEDRVWNVEVIEEHDEEAMVCQLVEFSMPLLVVLNEDVGNSHQHLHNNKQTNKEGRGGGGGGGVHNET